MLERHWCLLPQVVLSTLLAVTHPFQQSHPTKAILDTSGCQCRKIIGNNFSTKCLWPTLIICLLENHAMTAFSPRFSLARSSHPHSSLPLYAKCLRKTLRLSQQDG